MNTSDAVGCPYNHGHYDVRVKEAHKCTKFSKMAPSPLTDQLIVDVLNTRVRRVSSKTLHR